MAIDEEVEEIIEDTEISDEETIEDTEVSEEEEVETESEEEESSEDDRIVTIGDSEPEEEEEESKEAPGWVKKVRKVNREQEREIKRLKKQLEEVTTKPEEEIELGEKPTLESAGFDDKKFEKALLDWHERAKKVEEQKAAKQKAVEEQNKVWQTKQERYANLKQEHSFKDFKDAEDVVSETFNTTQQGIIVQGADDPALLVYALGKNPAKLEEMSKVTDPVEFAFKLAKLEAQLKVTNRKAPAPEKRVSGGKNGSGSADRNLEKLREKAAKTGDFTELNRYKRQLKQGAN
jgi:hypothetical protein